MGKVPEGKLGVVARAGRRLGERILVRLKLPCMWSKVNFLKAGLYFFLLERAN